MFFILRTLSWSKLGLFAYLSLIGFLVASFSHFTLRKAYLRAGSKYRLVLIYVATILIIPLSASFLFLELPINYQKMNSGLIQIVYFLIILATHTYSISLINKQEESSLKQKAVEASLKYQQLKSQISPHFLFNNISVLTGLIEENQEKAVQFSEDLSKVYRYFLDQETQDLVALKNEIAFANKYIALLKVRFENALIFNNNVAHTDAFYILPMALQQVFENVVKHNELSTDNPINITMSIDDNFLIVSNTLHPKLSTETAKPTGLENIKNRYAYFTDEKVIINKDISLFTIKLPLLKPEV